MTKTIVGSAWFSKRKIIRTFLEKAKEKYEGILFISWLEQPKPKWLPLKSRYTIVVAHNDENASIASYWCNTAVQFMNSI